MQQGLRAATWVVTAVVLTQALPVGAVIRRPLPRLTSVAPNVWVPFDLPAFSVQGHGNAGLHVVLTGVSIPGVDGLVTGHAFYSRNVEFVFGGGAYEPVHGVPTGTYMWTRGSGGVNAHGLYNHTTTFASPTEALNEALGALPRTNRLRVYAWCNSALTPDLHAATQLRMRLLAAWNMPGDLPPAVLEAPGFPAVNITGAQARSLVWEGRMMLPASSARTVARMLAPGGYVRVPFNGPLPHLLSDRSFARLNNFGARHPVWTRAGIGFSTLPAARGGGEAGRALVAALTGDDRLARFVGVPAGAYGASMAWSRSVTGRWGTRGNLAFAALAVGLDWLTHDR